MSRLITIIIILGLGLNLFAQDNELSRKEERRLRRQLKKEQKAESDARQAMLTELLLSSRRFVLEADMLRDRRGGTVNVSSMINFIACDSLSGVIQVGNSSYVGLNGVGGITVEGSVVNYEFTRKEKNGAYMVSWQLRTPSGTYYIQMSVTAQGRADATVSSIWPGRLSYVGNLVSPSASIVYKGTSF